MFYTQARRVLETAFVAVVTLALKTDNAHLLFQSGRVEVLLGPAGTGKSRMLRLLAGLDSSIGAHVFAAGAEVTNLHPAQRRVRLVAQGGVVYPSLSVWRNLLTPLRGRDASARARAAAESFSLTDVLDVRAADIDASTKQRVGLAKALASGVDAVLLDEPFAAIDSTQRAVVKDQVRAAFVGRDRILVIATASAAVAQQMAGNLHLLSAQAVLQRGSPAQLLAQPVDERAARVVHGAGLAVWPIMLVLDATLGRVVQLADKLSVPAPAAWDDVPPGPHRLGILAPCVHLERRAASDIEVRAEVVRSQVEGGETTTSLTSQGREIVVRQAGWTRLAPRQIVSLFFALADALLFSARGLTLRAARQFMVAHGAN